jgi:hypothetical protein
MAYTLPRWKKTTPAAAAAVLAATTMFSLSASGQGQPEKPADKTPAIDEVIFTNGDRLSGKLTRITGDSVLFHSDIAGDVTVPLAKVKELHTQGNYAVLKHGDPVAVSQKAIPGRIDVTDNKEIQLEQPSNPALTIPAKNVAYVIDQDTFNKNLTRHVGLWNGWGGSVNLGTSFTQATIHGGTVTGGVALIRQIPVLTFFPARSKTTANFQENYGVLTTPAVIAATPLDVEAKTSIMHADAEHDIYFTKRVFALGTVSFDHNYAQSMDLQQIYGGGFGWTAIQTAKQQLDLKGDAHYEKQQLFDRSLNQNIFGSTFSDNYRLTLPYKMVLTQTAAILPAWNNQNAYSANGSINLAAPLYRRVALNLNASDSFINNPTPGYQKNTIVFTTGLTYTLR